MTRNSVAARGPRLIVAGGLGTTAAGGASSRRAGRPRACPSDWADAASAIRAACSSLRSARHRRCDASSRARTAGRGSPRRSHYRPPSAARSRVSDRSCGLGAVIAIALLVFADQFAEPPGPQLRAESLPAPPREDFEKKQFHGARPVREVLRSPDAIDGANCPVLFGHKPVRSKIYAAENARNRCNPFIPRTVKLGQSPSCKVNREHWP